MVALAGSGLWRKKDDIAVLLGATPRRASRNMGHVDLIAGWGTKQSAVLGRRLAEEKGVPFVALEDGFLRSVRAGEERPVSFVIDDTGIYYDAASPCRLEHLVQEPQWFSDEERTRARAAIALLRSYRLSKYNAARRARPDDPSGRILVVDQTVGDLSIEGAGACSETFEEMLVEAVRLVGAGGVAVKVHPEATSGRKKSQLLTRARMLGVAVIADPVNVWDLLDRFEEVYTVSSQLGFEALLAGRKVTCFGLPFYAGWGLTSDRRACPRRSARPSLDLLAAAALLRYCRYLDPWERRPVTFEQAAEDLAFLRDRYVEQQRPLIAAGFSRWKRKVVRSFVNGASGQPRFVGSASAACRIASECDGSVMVWGQAVVPDEVGRPVPVIRVEDGFLRSVGLGAAFVSALSLVFDSEGIYYDPSRPSTFERLAREEALPESLLERARMLRSSIVTARLTKYNDGREEPLPDVASSRRIFVPGQVEDDASVILGATDIEGNSDLLRRVRARNPDAFILYKPHPDVQNGYRRGLLPDKVVLRWADAIVHRVQVVNVLDWCDTVETMTSLAGFEGLLRCRRVVTHGQPFYAGWGLTEDLNCAPRGRSLTVEELVAVALILYPRYCDPVSRLPCRPELAVLRLMEHLGERVGLEQRIRHIVARARHLTLGRVSKLRRR